MATEISYKGKVIASLDGGQTATLQCAGKQMVGDVVVQAQDNFVDGYIQAESDYWDLFQDYGNRVFYEYAFAYSAFEHIRPKYKVVPTSRTIAMFASAKVKSIEKKYFDFSQAETLEDNSTRGHYNTFFACASLNEIEDVGLKAGFLNATFSGCINLRTIAVLRMSETCGVYNAFTRCYALENITIDGTIGQDRFNVGDSPRLTHESLMSIINALKDFTGTTTTRTVTLGATNLAKLTDAEKAIATEKGWTLA